MTKEEAIAILRCLKDREAKCLELIRRHPHPNRLLLTIQAIDIAIEALQKPPITQRRMYQAGYRQGREDRPRGEWIESREQNILMAKRIEKGETWRVCSNCGTGFMIGAQLEEQKCYGERFHNFCPRCGADMRGGERSE